MPHIIVIADQPAEDGEPPIMFRERVSVSDFDSQHFATQLIERLGWAVGDADEADRCIGRIRRRSWRPPAAGRAGPAEEAGPQPELAGVSADRARPAS